MTVDTDDPVVLRAAVRRSRREFAQSQEGRIARGIADAVKEYLAARAQGVSREDACRGLEEVLRASGLFRESKFPLCDPCQGGGQRITYCTHAHRCGRQRCSFAEPESEHTYAVPCECVAGDRFRRRSTPPSDDDLTKVGKSKPRRTSGWRAIGR